VEPRLSPPAPGTVERAVRFGWTTSVQNPHNRRVVRTPAAVHEGGWRTVKVFQHERQLRTSGGLSVRDITDDVSEAVRESGVVDGIACVYSPHTTCCVRVNEFESGFLEDFANMLKRLVPSESYYAHDDWDRRTENICPEDMDFGNGHSHCMAMLLGTAGESIPVRDGELCLGTWQRVLFLELDRERDRRWIVQVVGT
jgi:secondary thiamine-phosphate synthase enzyme